MSQSHKSETNRLLGYPDDARLPLVNADDFGMYPATNEAIVLALKRDVAIRLAFSTMSAMLSAGSCLKGIPPIPVYVGLQALLLDRFGQQIHGAAEQLRKSLLQGG